MVDYEYTSRHKLDHISTVAMVLALNSFDGVRTTESCCGHGHHAFTIEFSVEKIEDLLPLLYWFRKGGIPEHPHTDWEIRVSTDAAERIEFQLKGPRGDRAYKEAVEIAEAILLKQGGWHRLLWRYICD
jgi:hypothetical protein